MEYINNVPFSAGRRTQCWKCKTPIYSSNSDKCEYCNWLICNHCGKCSPDCNINISSTYSQDGYDKDGYDINGCDKNGFNKLGYDINGYDKNGFNKSGYDINGYDINGFNKNGNHKNGTKYSDDGYDKNGYSCKEALSITDQCKVEAIKLDTNESIFFIIDTKKYKIQKSWVGKKINDTFSKFNNTYRILKIYPKR